MGATTDFRVYMTGEKKTVRERFKVACDNARYENGHGGYTGTIAEMGGISKWKDLLLETIDAAEEYIEENHDKWDPAMAVSFKLENGNSGWVVGGWCSE